MPFKGRNGGGEHCNLTRLCCDLFWVWPGPAACWHMAFDVGVKRFGGILERLHAALRWG